MSIHIVTDKQGFFFLQGNIEQSYGHCMDFYPVFYLALVAVIEYVAAIFIVFIVMHAFLFFSFSFSTVCIEKPAKFWLQVYLLQSCSLKTGFQEKHRS